MARGTRPTPEEAKARLGLGPHPTCGFVIEAYRTPWRYPPGRTASSPVVEENVQQQRGRPGEEDRAQSLPAGGIKVLVETLPTA